MTKTKRPIKSKAKQTKPKVKFKVSKRTKIIFGSFLMLFAIGLFISFVSYFFNWQADQSLMANVLDRTESSNNWLNKFGAYISHSFIYKGFGISILSLPVMLFFTGMYLFLNLKLFKLRTLWFWGAYVILWFSLLLGFFASSNPILGGVVGFELNDFLQDYIGKLGVTLILIFTLIIYLVSRLHLTPDALSKSYSKQKKQVKDEVSEVEFQRKPTSEDINKEVEIVIHKNNQDSTKELNVDKDVEIENSYSEKIPNESKEEKEEIDTKPEEQDDVEMEVETTEDEGETDQLSRKLVEDFGEFDPTLELANYRFPSIELLKDYNSGRGITIDQKELEQNKNNIVDTLKNYKIEIAQIKATVGPTVTLYEIVPEAGIRISKIKNLEDDIALSLSALGIRIIAPIPGRGTIGIEVPNQNPSVVPMRSVVASNKFQNAEMELPIAMGKTISNETYTVDLAKMPHLLMAGATGQGKSVGLNVILTSLLYQKHPAEVKFILVDPKKVELTLFNKIERHYLAKLPDTEEAIITDNTKVIDTLNSLCIEMDNRYNLLKDALVRNIKEYNTKFKARKLNPENGHKFLPYIVLVVDEFADLIMTAGKEVETPIARLAQLARAIGIHLIIATQRPSVNVITGMIKANFPARMAFRVTSKIDSRTILDAGGADQLIGRGDMLFTQGNDLIRLQCAFVDTPEVERITDFIGSQKAYPDAYLLPEYSGEDSGTGVDNDIEDRDKLFKDAAEVIINAQQGSASLLQRKLKLGYNRAGRIIDQLEAAGIVGPFEGSKARQVLVPDFIALEELLKNEQNS
ncbi:cell division DNA translocase FtsK [Psychroflexus torquis ATCC 700755]|uniref:Cell division DNA translocase FtsK n=1 Tax=Psychroflexus torquis (strain ATCC 700755 / CIP 106069 / ACAM 623) TaxID=313595 RepID=K4IK72_PSYTT|nr:DNA translocase FtsK [Psychroflexus torquis]AFU70213.1 cell division DNA translocase FtsK [Psychroflexus torquis ATCC 700755]